MKTKLEEQVARVHKWADDRDLYNNSTAFDQLKYFGKEFLEYVTHVGMNDALEEEFIYRGSIASLLKDDIGDMLVTLINVASLSGIDFVATYESAEVAPEEKTHKKQIEECHDIYSDSCFTFDYIQIENNETVYDFCEQSLRKLISQVKRFALTHDIDPIEALEGAVDEIWEREGEVVDGAFVKKQ